MKNIITYVLALALIFPLTACSEGGAESANAMLASRISVSFDSDDMNSSSSNTEISYIELRGDTITLDGRGAIVDGKKITIVSAGTYSISGTLNDGQIMVITKDKRAVKLIFNGVNITCSTSAPVFIINSKKTVITLAEGTDNYITDGASYVFEDGDPDEPNATIFSKDNLTISGNGSLTVKANYNNGIQSKDTLKITGGNINVNAVNDGIKGRDSIAIRDGNITVNAGGDGMQSTNNEDLEKGFVYIEGGAIDITAREDGIQAETSLIITGGNITITSGGGSDNIRSYSIRGGNAGRNNPAVNTPSFSAKGLKAGVDVIITGGTINIDSSDDAINSNDSLTINGGNITLASGDDGIHSDSTLEINNGTIHINKCYEGLESAIVTLNDGGIFIVARDDGINVIGVNDGFFMPGFPGQNMPEQNPSSITNFLYINGGYIAIDATGDGLDINGSINMTGGFVIINGPRANDNGALDYYGVCEINGGFLVAVGSSGMAQAPSISSIQYSVMVNLSSSKSANTVFHVETEDGEEVITFSPTKTYQSIVLSSPELTKGVTYVAYTGGSSTGAVNDSLYTGGKYTAGDKVTSFTISSTITTIGSPGMGFPGGRRW